MAIYLQLLTEAYGLRVKKKLPDVHWLKIILMYKGGYKF